LRTFDNKNGYKIIDSVYKNEPGGIRDRQLRFHTQLNTRTFDKWKRRLIELSILEKDEVGCYHLTQRAFIQYEKNMLSIPPDERKKKNRRIAERKSRIDERRTNAYLIIITLAAMGNYHYKESKNQRPELISIYLPLSRREIDLVAIHRVGVGISDFTTSSDLDNRILLGYNERFAYLNLGEQEFMKYISELMNFDDKSILRDLKIHDYEFLSYEYEFDKPDSTTIQLDNASQFDRRKRILFNDNETDNKLLLMHDIYYDDINDISKSKIVLNVNNRKTRRTLRLDDYYGSDFSMRMFNEKRYVIGDPLLKEFVSLCNQMLELVWWRMEYAYVHKLLPKIKGERITGIYKSYFRWFERLYGSQSRRTKDYFLTLNNTMIRKIKTLKDKGKRERILEILARDYRKTPSNMPQLLQDGEKNTQSLLESIDRVITKNYKRLSDREFMTTREKYPVLTDLFLEISYPVFMRDIHKLEHKVYTT
jgi:hypothetical protein